ncbi:hypothetical protein NMG60_11025338 [Bertholletia excelsa]
MTISCFDPPYMLLAMQAMLPVTEASCYIDILGGGCPDKTKCFAACAPCYIGIGIVKTYCVAPGGGILYWRCRCDMEKGAPCNPPGCGKPPALAPRNTTL